jgi:hypothetical protein
MIIDGDCHISPTVEGGGNSISYEELLQKMDRAGVDKALTWLQPPYRRETDPANAYVHEAMTQHPDRILGFGWADPNLGVEQAIETVKRCVDEYGFYGVKMNGAQNDYFIDDPDRAMPVVEAIAASGKLLAFHVGADAPDQTNPFRVAKIAERFPETQILMVHMGGVTNPNLGRAAIEVAETHPNLTLIASAIRGPKIMQAIEVLGAERVCYGSDTPFEYMRGEAARFLAMLDGAVSTEGKALVMGGNIARLFGLNA